MGQNAKSRSTKLPDEALTETTAIIKDLDGVIAAKLTDLEGLRALTRALLANTPVKDIIKQHVGKLAKSSRDTYLDLRKTRDRLMELQGEQDGKSLSHTDLLTGLPNDTALMRVLAEDRRGENQALIIVEMTGINVVADELGAKVARRIIVRAAALLRRAVKERDLVARMGPDSFALLLQDVASGKGAVVAHRIFDVLAQKLSPSGANVVDGLILAIGLTVRLSSTEDPKAFVARALSAVSEARTLKYPKVQVL